VLGSLRARRGDPDPWSLLDEARALAETTGEAQRLGPAASARAEGQWLAGWPELVAAETDEALALAVEQNDAWAIGELSVWRGRAGILEQPPVDSAAEPFRLELAGEPEAAREALVGARLPVRGRARSTGEPGRGRAP